MTLKKIGLAGVFVLLVCASARSTTFCSEPSATAQAMLSKRDHESAMTLEMNKQRIIVGGVSQAELNKSMVEDGNATMKVVGDVIKLFREKCKPGDTVQIETKYKIIVNELCDLSKSVISDNATTTCAMNAD